MGYRKRQELHEYELYIEIEGIDHSKTQVATHKTMVYASAYTELCRRNFMLWLVEKSSTQT